MSDPTCPPPARCSVARSTTRFLAMALAFGLASAAPPVLAAAPSAGDHAPKTSQPNVFLIVIDTLRADHLSAYGYGRETSPFLDELAARGTVYEQAISAAPWTLPAHASLFTGLHPRDHGTTSNQWTLAARFDTLAERLRDAGYRTGGFSNNVWTNDVSGLKQGFDTFEEMWREQEHRTEGISKDDPTRDMGAARTTDRILDWIDLDEGGDAPFFVFVNYFEPHLPYRPTRPFDGRFLPADAHPAQVQRFRSFYTPREYGYILRAPGMELRDNELEILTALYDAEIAYVDSQIERLVGALESRGLLDDTVLVITSDHGDHLGENHMLDHKFSVYEPLLRVPLILWGPGRVAEGRRIETQVQAHRSYATVLDLAGVEAPDMRPLPVDEPARGDGPRYTFAHLDYPKIFLEVAKNKMGGWNLESVSRSLTAVRGPRYKLIVGSDGSKELYDLSVDPLESNDLAAQHPEVVARLQRALVRFETEAANP